jgi:nicotinamide riboside kinase
MKKIRITGPESSGKSYIAKALTNHFLGGLVIEYSREYLQDKLGYIESDLLKIAQGQKKLELLGEKEAPEFLFCDTGCEVIKIWSQEKYGSVHKEIIRLDNDSSYDLTLLCKPNIPWQEDSLRENPNDRDRLFKLYLSDLKKRKIAFKIIDERLDQRLLQAVSFLDEILKEG